VSPGRADRQVAATRAALLAVLLFILVTCISPTAALAQCPPVRMFTGHTSWPDPGHLGRSIAGAGDVDKDGCADVIVGGWRLAPQSQFDAGRAVVFSGRTGQVLLKFSGENPGDGFGYAVDGAGDINGDGYADLVVGAMWNDAGGGNAGRAYVFSGRDGSVLHVFTGESAEDALGVAVSGAGDVNGDGSPDVIVGAYRGWADGEANGLAYVYSGQDGSVLYKLTAGEFSDEFGYSVSGAGDLNRDGYDDVIVGARGGGRVPPHGTTGPGRAYVYSGRDGALLHVLEGESPDDLFGFSVSGGMDVNADTYPDVIVGAVRHSYATHRIGRVYVYSGRTGELIRTWSGQQAGVGLGQWVDGVGDIDGDGFGDVIAGKMITERLDADAGAVYLFSGRTGALLFTFMGERPGDCFGRTACGLGDINGDGLPDIGVAAPKSDAGWTDFGRAYAYTLCRVDVDVLPGQCPNEITFHDDLSVTRPTAAGVRDPDWLTAAFVGSASLDVNTINPTTVLLEGVAPLHSEVRDITAPPWTKESPCDCAVRGPDGYADLVLTFSRSPVDAAMHGESVLRPSDVVNLTAVLTTGEPIIGQDCLRFAPRQVIFAGNPDTVTPPSVALSNAPNPFNSSTMITFSLAEAGPARIQVFDVLGRAVKTLADGACSSGEHVVVWDGTGDDGRPLASGLYFYRLTAGSSTEVRKMLLLK
jgi:hypothetical protein